jgi:hypothetical protein
MNTLYHDPDDLVSKPMTMKQPEVDPRHKASFLFWGGDNTNESTTVDNTVNESARKLLQKATCDVIANNSQVFQQAFLASNYIEFSNIKCAGDFNVSGVSQLNDINVKTKIDMDSTVLTTIKNDMSTSVAEAFSDSNLTAGTSLGEVTGQLTAACTTAMGGDVSKSENLEINVKNICKDEVEKVMENKMTMENIQAAAVKAQTDNDSIIKDIQCGGNANISDINQQNVVVGVVDNIMKNLFSVVVVQTMMDGIERRVTKEVTSYGEIAAGGMAIATAAEGVGNALAQNITAAGKAVDDVGSGVAKAITPVTEMAEEVSEDANNTAQTLILSMILPLIVFIIVAGIVMSQMGAKPNA